MSAYRTKEIEDYRTRVAPGGPFLDKPFTIPMLELAVLAAPAYPTSAPRFPAQ